MCFKNKTTVDENKCVTITNMARNLEFSSDLKFQMILTNFRSLRQDGRQKNCFQNKAG